MSSTITSIKLTECPRDAMQGLTAFIPTDLKVRYLNALLRVGFDTLDFGSFVSPAAIPQMRDTAEVLGRLDMAGTSTQLLAIIANRRGAEEAVQHAEITYLGFPLSLSETFQQRNTNKSIAQAFEELEQIQATALARNKQLLVYLSMGFGNPYGDPYDAAYLEEFVHKLVAIGVNRICPSDTIGVSSPDNITYLFSTLIQRFPQVEFGAHLHSLPSQATEKIQAAYEAGCRRFDGAIRGFGGCPMAKDDLVGNIATEKIVDFFEERSIDLKIDKSKFAEAWQLALGVFPS
jgi:hydroxymethylglutaryl-CoA lyase